jgi:1-acyl-sn-glycerol-3-phosphate acyltransferase
VSSNLGTIGYRVAKRLLARPIRKAFDIHIDGAANVPSSGPCIVVANHRSFMDSIFLAALAERPVTFLAKAEYWDSPRTAWLFKATGQIPVRRGSPTGARAAMEAATDVLLRGGVVGLYPEGTRSRDGQLKAGNLGAARLAIAAQAPIIPVGLIGTEAVQAPDQKLPRLGRRVEVRFGAPIVALPSDNPRAQAVAITHDVMSSIAELSGQTYTRRRERELVSV